MFTILLLQILPLQFLLILLVLPLQMYISFIFLSLVLSRGTPNRTRNTYKQFDESLNGFGFGVEFLYTSPHHR